MSGALDQFDIRARAQELKVWALVAKPVDPDAIVEQAREATGFLR